MDRKDLRRHGQGYSIRITEVNGETQDDLIQKTVDIDNISRGGFRFTTDVEFELEDRVQVILYFPDKSVKDVLGRICYREDVETENGSSSDHAYGFSILLGFYELDI